MFYKGILRGHNTVFVVDSIVKLANKMNVVVSTVSRGLNGFDSPHYKFSIISEEEYLRIVNEKKAARVVSKIIFRANKKNIDKAMLEFCYNLSLCFHNQGIVASIRELVKDIPQHFYGTALKQLLNKN